MRFIKNCVSRRRPQSGSALFNRCTCFGHVQIPADVSFNKPVLGGQPGSRLESAYPDQRGRFPRHTARHPDQRGGIPTGTQGICLLVTSSAKERSPAGTQGISPSGRNDTPGKRLAGEFPQDDGGRSIWPNPPYPTLEKGQDG